MVVKSSLYELWMARNSMKCQQFGILFTLTAPFNVLSNCEPPRARRRMILPPLESSRRDESKGGEIIFLRALDGSQFDEMSKIRHFI